MANRKNPNKPAMSGDPTPRGQEAVPNESGIHAIARSLDGIRFGQITAIVQDGVIVQIDRTERFRLV